MGVLHNHYRHCQQDECFSHCISQQLQQSLPLQHQRQQPTMERQQPTLALQQLLQSTTSWRSQNSKTSTDVVRCQLCNKPGHVATICRSPSHNHFEAKANYISSFQTTENPWILDSGASQHITIKPHNMQEYNGMEEVSMGDGNKIPITHTGLTQLHASNNAFKLSHTLCAPCH